MVNPKEITAVVHFAEDAIEATSAAIHTSATATKLLEATGLHMPQMPQISAPAILGERIGSMLTKDKIKTFAEDLFGHLENRPSPDWDLEDRLSTSSWNHSRTMASAEGAISKAGIQTPDLATVVDTRPLYESLKGAPAARAALTRFAGARKEFQEANSAYNKAVIGPKFADTHGAINRLTDQSGLVRPRLKVSNQIAEADAVYSNFTVSYPTSAFDGSSVSLVKSSAHELTHEEQHQLQIFLKADQLGIGAQASREHVAAISNWFKAGGNETSPEAIRRGLNIRAGRFLTDEAAERANATIESSDTVAKMWVEHQTYSQQLAQLNHAEGRVNFGGDGRNLALELGHPQTGLQLSTQLFGPERGAQLFSKYSQNTGVDDASASLSRARKGSFTNDLLADIRASIDSTQEKMRPYTEAYLSSRHEVEAFANGNLAASFHPQNYIIKGSL